MTYQCQYFTISSSISECDHKCETSNAEPEIGPAGSCQTRRNLPVDGYGSGFGPPRVSGSGFWPVREPNRQVFAVQTRTAGGLPGPVANTQYVSASRLSFMDDLAWVATGSSFNQVVTKLEECAAKCIEWASQRGLQLNTARTEAALFTRRQGHKKRVRMHTLASGGIWIWSQTWTGVTICRRGDVKVRLSLEI